MKHLTLLSLFTFGAASLGSAAIIAPTLGSVVDPAGSEEVDHLASNSATLAAFNAQSGLGVVQNWAGATGSSDVIDLADVDIRITTSFTSIFTDGRDTATNLQTSGSGQNFAWSGSNGQTLTIEFGTWNGSTFTADRAVKSAGLAFVNFGGAYDTASDQTITYRDASDSVLSTQVFVGGLTDAQASGGTEYFSGLISATSGGKPISSRPLIREATPPTDLPSRRRFVKSVKNENEGVNHLIFVGENNNSGVPQQTGRFERHLIFPVPTKAFSGPETRMPDCRLSSATRQALGQSEPEHGLPQARAVVAALEDLAFVRQ